MIRTIRCLELFKKLFRRSTGLESNALHFCWNAAPDVRTSRHEHGLVLFHTRTGRVFVCNGSAAWIWDRLSSPLTPRTIAQHMATEYGLNPDQSTRDVLDLLSSLAQQGLVTRKDDAL